MEGIPWETVCTATGDQLLAERDTSESGTFTAPWQVTARGEYMLTTTNLMERAEPYLLPLEFARGTVNRLRNQASAWQQAGLALEESLEDQIHSATETLAHAATRQHEPQAATELSQLSISVAISAMERLGDQYSAQALSVRRQAGPLPTLLACRLEELPDDKIAKKVLESFNSIAVPFTWRMVEPSSGERRWEQWDALVNWANSQGLKVCGGPLVQLDRKNLPDWIYLWDEDWEELESYILGHVSAVVQRYRGRVQLWNIAGRVNVDPALAVEEEQLLRLTVDAIESVRNIDQRTPSIVSFDQPWAEYLAEKDRDLPPMHFADTLARAELGMAGFGLELNWGFWPRGTPPRDPVEVSRLIDRWTTLGHPLLVSLTAPSAGGQDAQASTQGRLDLCEADPAWQPWFVDHIVPILLAKNSVQAIVWNHWSDAVPHEFAYTGLVESGGRPKSTLKVFADLKRKYLS
jgi:hypothetical protein